MERMTEYQIDAFGVKRAVLVEAANRSICTGCKEDCDTCSLKRAVERLAAYEDTELEPGQVKDGIGGKAPCPLCDNARANGELTDRNDLHYRTVGDSEGGFRVMVGAGWGRPMRILFEQRRRVHPNRNEEAWMTVGIYEPKFCPNCGRELREYGGQK